MIPHLKQIVSLLCLLSLFLTTTLQPAFAQNPDPYHYSLDLDEANDQASVPIEALPIYDVYLPTVIK